MSTLNFNNLPYDAMENFGITKKDILNLPARTINALLNGRKSSLMLFQNVKISPDSNPLAIEGKLQFIKKNDDKIGVNFYPVKTIDDNKYKLSEEQINFLKSNNTGFVEKNIQRNDNSNITVLVAYDRFLNDYNAVEKNKLIPPTQINNVKLTPAQQDDFKNGKSVDINGDKFILNITNEIGISDTKGNTNKINTISWGDKKLTPGDLSTSLNLIGAKNSNVMLVEHLVKMIDIDEINQVNVLKNPNFISAVQKAQNEVDLLVKEGKYNNETKNVILQNSFLNFGKLNSQSSINTESSRKEIKGSLLEFGYKNYLYDPSSKEVFMAKIKTDDKVLTIWGGDTLKNEFDKNQIKKNDNVQLNYLGKENITLKVPVENDKGSQLAFKEIPYVQDKWEALKISKEVISNKNKVENPSDDKKTNLKSYDYSKSDIHFVKSHDLAAKDLEIKVERDNKGKVTYTTNGKISPKDAPKAIADKMILNRELHVKNIGTLDNKIEKQSVLDKINNIDRLNVSFTKKNDISSDKKANVFKNKF